ncbi:hypothetical protein CJD36_000315 [Flavipsychrobacter stenotrophus]|uniref:histidine kinase n=1 Tax=Flavipsychrobacter stenotrophus TaxID=2077091 RepID=A0A2S7SZX0_9BACT|nr:PAS domain-containing protein [Flavipsychrobacter stenotrophus]PQJ12238.1 hypothetical protein CJD36_000315 [Flavipsychrobacter stenotrophus]
MDNKINQLSRFSSFKIVLLYAVFSAVYIYTSDYFLDMFIKDVDLLSKMQTYKGLGFILITATLLFVLVKRNIDAVSANYQKIIDVQRDADHLLKGSEEKYMSLFNHSPVPMWIFELDTLRILLVNDAACDQYGFSQQEYRSMNLRDIRPSEDIPHMEAVIAESLKDEHYTFPDLSRHKKKNGEIIHVKVKNIGVLFDGKNVRLASAVDVTKEINFQTELSETNARLKLASEIAGMGYWTNNFANGKIHWSDELYKIFEVDPATFVLTLENIQSYFHPEHRDQFTTDNDTSFDENGVSESEQRIITPVGKVKWIMERIYMLKDEQGIPVAMEGITLDITNRKLAQQEIWESNERFKMLASATVEAIIDWDIENDTVIWGEGFQTLFGYDLSTYDNHLWSNNIHPDDREKVLADLQATLADPTKFYFNAEFGFLKANGDIAYVQHRGLFIRDANGKATRALAAMIDLTESLDKMRKIESQNKALKDIAWTQSHIVRAPLANLVGLAELLKDENQNELSHTEIIGHICDSAQKLDNLIHEIVRKTEEVDGM